MQIAGFLGTRADLWIDIVMVVSATLPLFLYLAIRYAKKGFYDLHKWMQIILFTITNLLVIGLEIDIRFGGLDSVINQSPYANSTELLIIFVLHLLFAIGGNLMWFWLILISTKRYPVHFTFPHKKYGIYTFSTITLSVITGWILYAMTFAA